MDFRWYCTWENKARREGRRQGNIDKYLLLVREEKTKAPIGDRHPDFLFTPWVILEKVTMC